MAYGNNYNNNYNQGNGNYNQGNNGYQRQGSYQRQGNFQQQPKEPVNPDEFIQERIDIYNLFVNKIRENGLEPADFAFMLGGWCTSFCMENKKR